ncbi:hypothetical protein GZH53_19090 [Flavihumibacter sp. R14]|nr:hypothetical protein [Flavihumibacter soli]
MPDSLTISTQKPEDPGLDYQELRRLGIAYIEKTASAIWTDYNIHDPGITTLEILCYAITDLSYRTTFSIPDLLATKTDTVKNIQQHFISAKNIFPNKALTANDYRKLLIDIEGIKNAWIKKDPKVIYADITNKKLSHTVPRSRIWEQVTIQGFNQALLEFDTNVNDVEKELIKLKAKAVLVNNRNLCEDFTTVSEVKEEKFRLCTEIEIAANANPVELMAQVYFNIQLHLTPMVKFYRLAEMFAKNYTSDAIYEGPLLEHGFIKNEELIASELKSEIHLSDIMQQIMSVSGVLNIPDIILVAGTQTTEMANRWVIDVPDGRQPVINILGSKVVLYKDGMPFRPRPQDIKLHFDRLMDAYIAANESVTSEDISYETGTYRDIGEYYSIQHHYPKTYGISHWGLPDDAPVARRVQARQFQAYLYFFDQQLANYTAQLANLSQLFSLDEDIKQTYFTKQPLELVSDADLLRSSADAGHHIQQAAEMPDTFDQRRNLFLDHLLSRFSESFFDYANILKSVFPDINRQGLINSKVRFLKNYPEYSSRRFAAYNSTDSDQWDTENISGLEKRLQSLLGFADIKRRTLVNLFSVVKSNRDSGTELFRFELVDNRTGNILMASAEEFTSAEVAERRLTDALDLGHDLSRYSFSNTSNGRFIIELKDRAGKAIAVGQTQHDTNEEAVSALAALHHLISKNQSVEGMFLVENILILPDTPGVASPRSPDEQTNDDRGFMPVCADQNCDDCEMTDPYSFRLSIILPAYSERFLNMNFRTYCERVIRMETPAHLYPKICWVNNQQLQEFEVAYKKLLGVKAGLESDPDNRILERFVRSFTTLKTVYPTARLEDCSSSEQRRLFLLNKNALGTLNT